MKLFSCVDACLKPSLLYLLTACTIVRAQCSFILCSSPLMATMFLM